MKSPYQYTATDKRPPIPGVEWASILFPLTPPDFPSPSARHRMFFRWGMRPALSRVAAASLTFLLAAVCLGEVSKEDSARIAPLAASLLKGDFPSAAEAWSKVSAGSQSEKEVADVLRELSNLDAAAAKSFAPLAGKEIDVEIRNVPRRIKILEVKGHKVYFEEKLEDNSVRSMFTPKDISFEERAARAAASISPQAKILCEGIGLFQKGCFNQAMPLLEKGGPLGEVLKAEIDKIVRPLNELMAAIDKGDVDSIRKTLDAGVNVNIPMNYQSKDEKTGKTSEFRTTFLMEALSRKQTEVVRMLVDKGADVNAANGRGMTPLMMAAMKYPSEPWMIKYLLGKGADINAADNSGDTALSGAICLKAFPAVKELVEAGADVNTRNRKGYTVLMLAVFSDNVETVKLLLGKGADINAKHTFEGWSLPEINHEKRSQELQALMAKYAKPKKSRPLTFDFGDGIKK